MSLNPHKRIVESGLSRKINFFPVASFFHDITASAGPLVHLHSPVASMEKLKLHQRHCVFLAATWGVLNTLDRVQRPHSLITTSMSDVQMKFRDSGHLLMHCKVAGRIWNRLLQRTDKLTHAGRPWRKFEDFINNEKGMFNVELKKPHKIDTEWWSPYGSMN